MAEIVNFNGIKFLSMPTIIQERRVGRMFSKEELKKCRSADICSCDINKLTDVTNLKVDVSESIIDRARKYFQSVRNPYMFRVGDVGVKINCGKGKKLSDSIIDIVNS